MQQNIDNTFVELKAIKLNTPLLNDAELHSILDKIDAEEKTSSGGFTGKQISPKLSIYATKKVAAFAISAFVLLLGATYYFTNLSNTPSHEVSPKNNSVKSNSIKNNFVKNNFDNSKNLQQQSQTNNEGVLSRKISSNNAANKIKVQTPVVQQLSHSKVNAKNISNKNISNKNIQRGNIQTKNITDKTDDKPKQENTDKIKLGKLPELLTLSSEELERLFIMRIGDDVFGLQYSTCQNCNYNETLFYKKIFKTNGNSPQNNDSLFQKANKVRPFVYSYFYYDYDGYSGRSMSQTDSTLCDPDIEADMVLELSQLYTPDRKNTLGVNIPKELETSKFAKYLVPVKIEMGEGKQKSYLVMQFLPNKDFINALSPANAKIVQKYFPVTEYLAKPAGYVPPKKSVPNDLGIRTDIVLKMPPTIKLRENELSTINLKLSNDGFTLIVPQERIIDLNDENYDRKKFTAYLKKEGADTNYKRFIMQNDGKYDTRINVVRSEPKVEEKFTLEYDLNKYNPFASVRVIQRTYVRVDTGYCQRKRVMSGDFNSPALFSLYSKSKLDSLNKMLSADDTNDLKNYIATVQSSLVPVEVMLGDSSIKTMGNSYSRIVLWYLPTPEFVDALPSRYRDNLKHELEAIKNGTSTEAVCSVIKGESLLDICRMNSESIHKMRLEPNLAKEFTRCKFILTKSMKASVTVHDILGKVVKEVSRNSEISEGANDIKIDLSGISAGVYMVAITAENGEQTVQRLVIK